MTWQKISVFAGKTNKLMVERTNKDQQDVKRSKKWNYFQVAKSEKLGWLETHEHLLFISSFTPQNVKAIYCSSLCLPRIMQ